MSENTDPMRSRIESIYREESRRVLATLIRLVGDFDLAEEALQEAFVAALDKWPRDGIPNNPRAWLVSTGRFKAIDAIRKQSRSKLLDDQAADSGDVADEDLVEDDRLRLIFTCCHPALPIDSQIALTLREVCGLTTEEIASAFFTTASTIAQRIVRAKGKIRDARIPYEIPERDDLAERLDGVLHVIYLVFNEGYAASSGRTLTRTDLSSEAIRLGRLLAELMPDAEALGLLALMLLHEARREARVSTAGDLVLLADQDRSLWNTEMTNEGRTLVTRALASRRFGFYTLQAAIAAVHADATSPDNTDWPQIVELYNILQKVDNSPVIRLNRAVAVAMRDGPAAGLTLIDQIVKRGELADYAALHATRAELLRRKGSITEARISYRKAIELTREETQRRFLMNQLANLQ